MKRNIPFLIALSAVLAVNIFFRSFTIHFPQLKKQAHRMVTESVKKQALQHIYQKFPHYDPLANERLVAEEVAQYKKHNRKHYRAQVDEVYARLKDRYQDAHGQTYLMELDCWHWARYVKNVVDRGAPGDMVRSGRQVDSRMLAPDGDFIAWNQFNFYFPAFLYKLFSTVRYVPIFTFLFYLPLFYTGILIILLFFFAYRHGGYICAVLSCLFVGLSTIFIPRSTAGWFDMDILNLIFPIGIIWTYLCAQEAGGLKRKLLRLGVSGFLVGLFCFTWVNWWFIFLIIMMYETVSIAVRAVLIVRGRVESRDGVALSEHLISFGFFIAGSLFFVIILTRFEALSIWWNQIRDALILNKPLLPSIWPNVFSTVGELRKIKPLEISNSIGGPFVASLSVICMIIIVIRAVLGKTITGFKRGSAFILLLWFLSMLYATFRGVRFSMFLTVPLGIFLGWGINDMITYFLGGIRRWQRLAATAAVVVVFSAILLQRAYRVSSGLYPLMHDRWYEVLIALKEKTPPETVVNSWWDFGDWFKVVAERPVIFDGQSQNKPQAFWMARALLSHNEKESMGILRMLNNGGNRAFELIDEYLHDPLQSVLLLETVLPLDEAEARRVLSDFLPSSALDEMLLLLFDEPPAAEFLVDYSLVFKITAISYLGNWNFAKVYMVQNYNRIEKERIIDRLVRLGKDRSLMQKFYQEMVLIPAKELERWISRPVQYFSTVIPGKKQGDAVVFENGFVYKPEEKVVYANDGKLPRSLFLKTGNHIQEFLYQKPGLVFSTLIWENEHGYFAVLLDPALGRALFTRLYFLDGMKSRHFLPHIRAFDGGNFIGTYKIQW